MYHSLYMVHSHVHVYTTLDLGHWKSMVKYIPNTPGGYGIYTKYTFPHPEGRVIEVVPTCLTIWLLHTKPHSVFKFCQDQQFLTLFVHPIGHVQSIVYITIVI